MAPAKIAVVYDSGYGHTEKLAEHVVQGLESVEGVVVKLFTAEEATNALDALDEMHAIVFGSPTYMGGVSAPFKAFADATSRKWLKQAWKDKLAAGFTNSGSYSGDKVATLQYLSILAAQHAMVWVGQGEPGVIVAEGHGPGPDAVNRLGSYLGLMAQSDNAPPEHAPSSGDLETARRFGIRIAQATKRWNDFI